MQYENLGPGEERATGEMSKKKKVILSIVTVFINPTAECKAQ